MQRRKFIATVGVGMLAGCSGADTEGTTTDGSGSDTSSSDNSGSDATDSEQSTTDETESSETTTEGTKEKSVKVGTLVDDEQMSMVVRGVEKTKQLSEFDQASSGNTFVVVQLAVKNTTKDSFLNFSGFLQTRVKDGEGYSYDQAITGSGNTFSGGQLVPGEVSRGSLVYEVPEDASNLSLDFDFQTVSFLSLDRVTVDLEQEASSTADLSQDLKVDVHDSGKTVSRGDVGVTVNGVEFSEKLDSFTQAGDGKEFAIVDITTKNDTSESKQISTLLQMLVKDGTGKTYPLSISASTAIEQSYDETSPLGAGEKRRGKVAYEVDKGVSPLYWAFEFTLWTDGDKTFWQLR